ncbi:hypothetical protein [Hymenobacter latericus]|uniref:hypothetical protein n=1 Tax=Hymenobacter sp. YIM 151858-1 TaxID=2987688 RepID=UPI0022274F2E|nr:hypothetical protein [Hymenobacter sp. YIM 151858-1]UYZ58184.1 hypothetical protein OIS50_14085 [Hymenobacter sp. YIM 151858-1]
MKTLCFSLLVAVLAAAPSEASHAATPAPETTSTVLAEADGFGGGYKLKRKKRKKNRSMRRYRRLRGLR